VLTPVTDGSAMARRQSALVGAMSRASLKSAFSMRASLKVACRHPIHAAQQAR